jgi:hypothetical protein
MAPDMMIWRHDTQHSDTQHNNKNATHCVTTLSITALNSFADLLVMMSVAIKFFMLSVMTYMVSRYRTSAWAKFNLKGNYSNTEINFLEIVKEN